MSEEQSKPQEPASLAQRLKAWAQRTKTDGTTTRTLSVVWGTRDLPGRTEHAVAWYREILESLGARTEAVAVPDA